MTVHKFKSKQDLTIDKFVDKAGMNQILHAELKDFLFGMAFRLQRRRLMRVVATYEDMRVYWLGLDVLTAQGGDAGEIAEAERLAKTAHRKFERAASTFYECPITFDRPDVMKPLWDKNFATPFDG